MEVQYLFKDRVDFFHFEVDYTLVIPSIEILGAKVTLATGDTFDGFKKTIKDTVSFLTAEIVDISC